MSITGIKSRKHGKLLLTELEVGRVPADFDGFKIIQLSDLHLGSLTSVKKIDQVFKAASSLNPDLLLITGDYIQQDGVGIYYKLASRNAKLWRKYRLGTRELANQLLGLLEKHFSCQIVGVFGNHDHHDGIDTIKRVLGKKIEFLQNSSTSIVINDSRLMLAGIDDFRFGKPCIKTTLEDGDESFMKILLAHNPDTVLLKNNEMLSDVDLMLSGHTHGGQICMPFLGPIRTSTRQREHIKGLSKFGSMSVYVNNGVGHCVLPVRFLSRAEITVIEFKKTS